MSTTSSPQFESNPGEISPAEPPCPPALQAGDPPARLAALAGLARETGPAARPWVNLHCHTIFSYNPYDYSPAEFAWRARVHGLEAAGIVDFDVVDGLEEFLEAGRLMGIPVCVSLETRVYVPEFGDRVLSSPGEPGIGYHMASGFPRAPSAGEQVAFLRGLRDSAAARNRDLVHRVNQHLAPLDFDYERDVLPLTPMDNATERHICRAYAERAAAQFASRDALIAFWDEKLGGVPGDLDWPAGPQLQALIRSKTMKRGGVGYVQPNSGSFPDMTAFNRFALASGAIPTLTWLDGTSDGEQCIEEWMDVAAAAGAAAINFIPDRNFTPGKRDQKLANLHDVVARARARDWPMLAGTEMNSPGLKFVDDFAAPELAPVVEDFRRGARILAAHTVLGRYAGLGYLSQWAAASFATLAARNDFYAEVGARFDPSAPARFEQVDETWSPNAIKELLT